MTAQIIFFTFFATVAVISSVLVITRQSPIISALFLVLNFAALAGMYLLLYAQFIAVVQIIVYAGAIMVLFLFVIMLLRPENEKRFFEDNPKMKAVALAVGILVLFQFVYAIALTFMRNPVFRDRQSSMAIGTVEAIGKELYTNYLLPFEATGFLLLAAAIGALILAKKKLDVNK